MSLKVWGFQEYSPQKQIIFEDIKSIISKSYQQFWYTPIDTPSVEKNKVLLSKTDQETNKQIFWLYWLAQWPEDTKKYSLRYDLTVPFARYTIDNINDIDFPFKRSQIQKVWRWERSQKWRFKEFFQADIDVIRPQKRLNSKDQYVYYNSEIIIVLYKTIQKILDYFEIDKQPTIHINSRKLINWLLKELLDENQNKKEIIKLFDDYYKIGKEQFKISLEDKWLSTSQIEKIIEFTSTNLNLENIKDFIEYIPNQEFAEWIKNIYQTVKQIKLLSNSLNININYKIDPFIVRWLDYYTWIVFETFIDKDLWSVCSWWKYDNLTQHINKKYKFNGIGWSIWISRLLTLIFDEKDTKDLPKTTSNYLFVNFNKTFEDIISLAGKFYNENKNIEIYPYERRIWKQFKYANQKSIPYVVILWQQEKENQIYKIKNMKTGEEKEYKLK